MTLWLLNVGHKPTIKAEAGGDSNPNTRTVTARTLPIMLPAPPSCIVYMKPYAESGTELHLMVSEEREARLKHPER